jgi:hypothetical protein
MLTQVTQNKPTAKNFQEIRIRKIRDYAQRQSKRSITDKKHDYQNLTEEQKKWVKTRMVSPAWTWLTFNGDHVLEEWEPWDRYGEPVNRWRCYNVR